MNKRHSERGSALIIVTVISLILMGISGAYMTLSYLNTRKTEQEVHAVQALFIADTAAKLMVHSINYPKPGGATVPTAVNVAQKNSGGTYIIPTKDPRVQPKDYAAAPFLLVNYGANGVDDNKDGKKDVDDKFEQQFYQFQAWGTFAGVTRKVEVLLSHTPGDVYWNAVFAGNSRGDKYTLSFNDGDVIEGDIYTGGSFDASSGAKLLGDNGVDPGKITYNESNFSTLSGPTFEKGSQEALDLRVDAAGVSEWQKKAEALRSGTRRDSDGVAYIDVAYDLAKKGSTGNFKGSNGVQITDKNEPAHMFRKDPTNNGGVTNRTESYEYTPKASGRSDYYFEDPTGTTQTGLTPVNGDTTAQGVNVSPNGNDAVYFIDGNMRVSGEAYKSYKFVKPSGMTNMKATMVVKGNVSFTDNMLLPGAFESKNDALAIIALVDPDFPNTTAADFQKAGSTPLTSASGLTIDQFVANYNKKAAEVRKSGKVYPDIDLSKGEYERASQEYNKAYGSGNVFFGDPGSGTVEHFEAFMYAENNFYATNLNTTTASGGTQKVEIFGNMTAGNQVKIVRDTSTGYVPLSVTLDTVIRDGTLRPPALPSTPATAAVPWTIASWKQVP